MSLSVMLVLVFAGLLALVVLVYGAVAIVALLLAKPEDVPTVLSDCVNVFRSLVRRMPGARAIRGRRNEEEL
jgi:hypothetical protein